MNRLRLLALVAALAPAASRADDAAARARARAREQADEINAALLADDYGKIADLTHPKVVGMLGGREKMVGAMRAGMGQMKAQGIKFASAKSGDPSAVVAAGAESFVVVPYALEMTAPGKRLRQDTYLVGVSSDGGKNWTFVNGKPDPREIKQVLPNLPASLTLPKKQKPEWKPD